MSSLSDTTDFVSSIPLFADLPERELAELVSAMRAVDLDAGEVLWRQGQPAEGLAIVLDGAVGVSLGGPGGEVALATLGPGEVLGEVPLVDGGTHSASALGRTQTRLLFLNRSDFGALTARRHPSAFAIRRRICAMVSARLRQRYAELAASLTARGRDASWAAGRGTLAPGDVPDLAYLRQLAFFRAFTPDDLAELLERSRVVFAQRGDVLAREGDRSDVCYVILNGAVEELIDRGAQKIPVVLAGPGRAFAYLGLIDDEPCPLAAIARERALLLEVPRAAFDELFHGTTPTAYALYGAIERDLMAALRRSDVGFVRATRSAPAA